MTRSTNMSLMRMVSALRAGPRAVTAICATIVAMNAHAGSFDALLDAYADASKECRTGRTTSEERFVLNEVFPEVIYKTPGRDLGSQQLFEPIRRIAEPLATLGSQCLQRQSASCKAFEGWVRDLATKDSLKFDRSKHRPSPVSTVTGTLAGNLTIRPIALYTRALLDAGLIHIDNESELGDWMVRRSREYDVFPQRLSPKAAQNLVLSSVLSGLVVDIATARRSDAWLNAERVYTLYLDTSRPDGSFPEETRRGNSALKYMNTAVSELVMLAELAEGRGRDLYGYRAPNGVTLHTAVAFLLDAIRDEGKIADYAKENFAPTDKPGAGQAKSFLRTHFSWANFYMRRFPTSTNTTILKEVMKAHRISASGFYDETLGLAAACGR